MVMIVIAQWCKSLICSWSVGEQGPKPSSPSFSINIILPKTRSINGLHLANLLDKNCISSFIISEDKHLFVSAIAISFWKCLFIPFVHFLLIVLLALYIMFVLSFVWLLTLFVVLFTFSFKYELNLSVSSFTVSRFQAWLRRQS